LTLESPLEDFMTSTMVCFYRPSNDVAAAKFIGDRAVVARDRFY
jgi:hypothetical protein